MGCTSPPRRISSGGPMTGDDIGFTDREHREHLEGLPSGALLEA